MERLQVAEKKDKNVGKTLGGIPILDIIKGGTDTDDQIKK